MITSPKHDLGEVESLSTPTSDQSEKDTKGTWTRQLDCVMALVGYSVGLTNFWRFPYVCIRNGGGAFLIPYLTFLIFCGFPLFYLEMLMGQFSSMGALCVWKVCPLFKGLGWAILVLSTMGVWNYTTLTAWVLYYLYQSFAHIGVDLPWASCNNQWNTCNCLDRSQHKFLLSNATNLTYVELPDQTNNESGKCLPLKPMSPTEEFWQYEALELSDGIENIGPVRWQMFLCLAAAWLIVFLCLCKGVKSLGKVVYVTATAPYILLTILLVRGLTLPGSWEGVKQYLIPDFTRLTDIQVWLEACLQMFYSLGPAWGGVITMSSFNKFNNNCLRDSIVVCVACGVTSFFAGCVIFSVLGFMAHNTGLNISDVVTSGPGLAFIVYPEAISRMPYSYIWAIVFFLTLLTLGLDSLLGTLETVLTGIVDKFPQYFRKRKILFTGASCLLLCILAIPLSTKGGMYIFQLIDWYMAAISILIIAFLEVLAWAWIYEIANKNSKFRNRFLNYLFNDTKPLYIGTPRIGKDMKMMLSVDISWFWKVCWQFLIPICLLIMSAFTCFKWKPINYGDYKYPSWAIGIGWMVSITPLIPIPVVACVLIKRGKGTLFQRFVKLLRPSKGWGPADEELKAEYKLANGF